MVYDDRQNEQFFREVADAARAAQALRENLNRLAAFFFSEGVSGASGVFLKPPGMSVEPSEVTSMITFAQDFEKFMSNQAVGQADRQSTVAPYQI